MRYYQLVEAPLADFDAVGDLDREGSLRPEDLRAIRNPKWREKVFRAFEKTPFSFNIYVFNAPEGIAPVGHGHDFDSDPIKVNDLANLNKYGGVQRLGVISNIIGKTPPNAESSITVLLVENEGAERVPLTPWIMAHRVSHAILEAANTGRNTKYAGNLKTPIEKLFVLFSTFFNKAERRLAQSPRFRDKVNLANDRWNPVANILGTFRSARTESIANFGEFVVELMSQYLVQGRVKFNRPELDDNGRMKPLDSDVDPAMLELAQSSRNEVAFADKLLMPKFWIKRDKSFPQQPEAFYQGVDAEGNVRATSTVDRSDVWKDRGMTTRLVEPSKREMTRWNAYTAARSAAQNLWLEFEKRGLLNRDKHSTDWFDDLLTQSEQDLNSAMESILNACIGKAIVL